MTRLSRRRLLAGGAALGLGALTGAVSGCGSTVSISRDPNELVLWYWSRSVSAELLAEAAQQIPGTGKRLRADLISDWDTKLRTSLAGQAYIPDVASINSNCSLYFENEDRFLDLNTLGAEAYRADYYDWKWRLGTTPTGRQLFWPMDVGPTGFYYRTDLFEQAGLPTNPDDVGAAVGTWDGFLDLGAKLKRDTGLALLAQAQTVMDRFLDASPERYFDAEDRPLFNQPGSAVRQAWDTAVAAVGAGITANLQTTNDQNSGWVSGKVAGQVSASWWMSTLISTAPETEGLWRIAAQPERAGNFGGSFLGIPSTCKDPEAAFAFVTWLTSPENQVQSFNELGLFPSTPGSLTTGSMKDTSGFFGEQDPLAFFTQAATTVPTSFVSGLESQVTAFVTELGNVESGGKDPERAWNDAVALTNQILTKRGVEV